MTKILNAATRATTLLACLGLLVSPATHAQTAVAEDSADQGTETAVTAVLTDTDVTENLAAEALPTTDRLAFWWEQARFTAINALTRNTERKADQYQLRLHQLDRKMAACAEIGDTECVERIENHLARLEERADRFMARRQELLGDMQERFEAWREQRAARHEEWRQQATERREQRQELRAERQEQRAAAKEQRQEKIKEIRELQQNAREQRLEFRQERQENRQEVRQEVRQNIQNTRPGKPTAAPSRDPVNREEKLIELRSQNVKNQLDTTRERVQQRTTETNTVE